MFYWKNISNNTKKLITSEQPMISKPERRIEKIKIPGRNGFLTIDEETYESFIITMKCHFHTDADQDDILAWLDGAGKLSLDNVREYDAIVRNAIKLSKVTEQYREFLVKFECQPLVKDILETEYEVTGTPDTMTIADATANMYPTMEITGTGNVAITINGKTFNLTDMDQKYTLDCDLKVITNVAGANISDKMLYDFPVLIPGDNEISYTGTITEFIIKYNKSYL